MSAPAALELIDVVKAFGPSAVIQGVSLQVRRGERHALIGPNGAGKSTLFHLISGLYTLTSGEIRLNGQVISGLAPHEINRRGLSRSFQITNIFPRLSVFENLRLGVMARHGIRFDLFRPIAWRENINAETAALAGRVRLSPRLDIAAGELSYSEQRALEIGMALATGAEVILLDEPTAGMSRDETACAAGLMREVTEGKTLLVVEHDMSVVFGLCDRISVLVCGQVLATGTPEEIRANRAVQAAYLGEDHEEAA